MLNLLKKSKVFKVLLLLVAATYLCSSSSYSQGVSVPSGTTLNVNENTLNVSGQVDNSGTVSLSSGTIKLTGNWSNTGTFTPATGAVEFNASSGTQTLVSGGTGVGKFFYTLSHSGAGTLQLLTNDLDVNNLLSNSAGTVNANGKSISIAGTWNNAATFTASLGTVTFDGTNQSIIGSSTFYNLIKTTNAAVTLTFDNTATQTVTNQLTLTGIAGNLLSLRSDSNGVQTNLTLQAGGLQTLQYLDVKDNDASLGLTLVAGSTSTGAAQNNTNWVFGGTTLTWQGDISADWDTPGNWDLGFVPTTADSVVIPDVTGSAGLQPSLASIAGAGVQVVNMTLQSSATFNAAGKNVVISGTLSNDGNFKLFGSETTVTIATVDSNSGIFTYTGDSDGLAENFTIKDIGGAGNDYYNLVINDASGVKDTFLTNSTLTLINDLTVTSATFDTSTNTNDVSIGGILTVNGGTMTATNSGTLAVTGNFVVSSGVFTAPTTAKTFTVAGNFTHSAGTFTHSSGIVTLNGTNQILSGSTTFYGLKKNVTASASLTFPFGATQTITNNLDLQGTSTATLTISSSTPGSKAAITLQAGATQVLKYLNVNDSDASGGLLLVARNSSTLTNTTNWSLTATVTWTGTTSTSWDVATNWNLGLVPSTGDDAIIPNVATQPSLVSNINSIDDMTVNASAIVSLAGFNFTMTGTLSNSGTITMFGSETVVIPTIDSDSGTFIITGDGDGIAEIFTILDFGASDYYNLTINDVNATPDTFVSNANLTILNNLTITLGTVNISTNTNTLTTVGTLTVNGGTLTATNGNIDANGSVVISSGALTAPTSSKSFTIADDFTHSGGTFTHSSGNVTFDTTTTTTIVGSSTFFDFTVNTPGKTILFTNGTTQTVNGTFTGAGQQGNNAILNSTAGGSKWDITFPNGSQFGQFLTVQDSNANTNTITCFVCTDNLNNNANWIFSTLAITVPLDGKVTDLTPTVIGTGPAGQTITIRDSTGATTFATTVIDANGNFRLELPANLATGANTLRPYLGAIGGGTVNFTAVASPSPSDQPIITLPATNTRVNGATPIITGQGLPSTAITIQASDSAGSMLLQTVGSGTISAGGNYSITLTTALLKGLNYVSVSVGGVASNVFTYTLTDPFGIVFDSSSNQVIQNAQVSIYRAATNVLAVPGVDLDSADVNPLTTGVDGAYSFLTANGNYYIVVSSTGYQYPSGLSTFPSGRVIVTGSKGEQFTVAGVVIEMDHPLDSNGQTIRVVKDANKSEVRIGDVVTYTVTMQNLTTNSILGVYLDDTIPPGFKYLEKRVLLDDAPTVEPVGNRPLAFYVGTIGANATRTLKYQLVVGAGVSVGNYDNVALARYSSGVVLSNTARETVKVVLDPLFDLGTVIGKVFFDVNENGIQDPPQYVYLDRETISEDPVPNVRIMMEDGTIVTTDKDGKYSIPALNPGRHLLRLDERTLPEGSYLTTDKAVIIDVTPGILTKVNFGVNLDYSRFKKEDAKFFVQNVNISQDQNKPKPRLNVALFGNEINVYDELFVDNAEFRIFSNYASFLNHWRLEIVDKDTDKIIRTFDGDQLSIFDPILWDGRDTKGNRILVNRNYIYRLLVEDDKGKFDETKQVSVKFNVMKEDQDLKNWRDIENVKNRLLAHQNWLLVQNTVNNLMLQNIFIDGETVIVQNLNADIQNIRVTTGEKIVADIPVVAAAGISARDLLEGSSVSAPVVQPIDIILPRGNYQIVVQDKETLGSDDESQPQALIDKNAALGPSVPIDASEKDDQIKIVAKPTELKTYAKEINVGQDYMYFVGLGDAKIGYTFNEGNVEAASQSDKFNPGFWSEGKLSYFLKGKIKGKYLVTSSFDSDRNKKDIFKSFEQDKYYPVYGDASSLDKGSADTQGNLYLLVEADKSSALWGNYSVNFDDTEFAKFSRSLYGGKVEFETLATNQYGDPRTKVVAFRARAQQRAAHNEFVATGGSLYYFKHRDVIEGTDNVFVEIRDKVTGLVIKKQQMKSGADYEVDYKNGRIIFWRPVPILVDTYSIISNNLLNGNFVYVIADYEYSIKDQLNEDSSGARAKQAIGKNVIVGTTYIKDSQNGNDYQLRGTDVTVKLGESTTVKTEYAQTNAQAQGVFVSTDGGLNFEEINTPNEATGVAYGITGDTRLFNRIGIDSYYKWVGSEFSTTATSAQQGKEIIGIGGTYDVTDSTRLTAKYDIQNLIDDGNIQTRLQVGATRTATTLVQLVQDFRQLKLTAEYTKQEVTSEINGIKSQTNKEGSTGAIRADYTVNDKLTLSLAQQAAIDGGTNNNKTTIGATVKPTDQITLRTEQTIGQSGGSGATAGASVDLNERLTVSGDYAVTADNTGTMGSAVSVGAASKVDESTLVKTTVGTIESTDGKRSNTIVLAGSRQVDAETSLDSQFGITDSLAGGQAREFTFGTKRKLSDELKLATSQSFGIGQNGQSTSDDYSLIREKDGRKVQGTLSRKYSLDTAARSQTNIFGLTGDVNDQWALAGTFERGNVFNYDLTEAKRNVISLGAGFVKKDAENQEQAFKSSTKIELRTDDGDADKRQYLITNASEGKVSPELTLFNKFQISRTRNLTQAFTEAQFKEFTFGAAYRPVMMDRLNLIGRYTYKENLSPSGQVDSAGIQSEKANVYSIEGIYDLNDHWQISEKYAYRIGEEKVVGFDFNRTHTWLMIHRLNYKIDKDWTVGSEFRMLMQEEAADSKSGVLIEISRKVTEYAQIGAGYNFTNFTDDLTDLDYRSQGPFMRVTGKLYDRNKDEVARNRQKWIQEKIDSWAWHMVQEELNRADSPIILELNGYYIMAEKAKAQGKYDESQKIYRDIIVAGQMMFQEASEYVWNRIGKEEKLQEMSLLADQYFRQHEYEKAKKILEKILEEVDRLMIELTN